MPNEIITPEEMVKSIVDAAKKAQIKYGLSEEETAKLAYELAGSICGFNRPMKMDS